MSKRHLGATSSPNERRQEEESLNGVMAFYGLQLKFWPFYGSAVGVHLALVFCYVSNLTAEIAISLSLNQLSNFVTIIIVVRHNGECFSFFNSTLNPFLYLWKTKYTRRLMFLNTQENLKNAPLFTLSYMSWARKAKLRLRFKYNMMKRCRMSQAVKHISINRAHNIFSCEMVHGTIVVVK